ncbi:MAG: MoaD/ThiS family protein [Deltaproteobacteria bacterium]|nr:MoaD/ThiS family protein [Deltaproteobacteria bacterium]MBW2413937.1 MoaD/ThiS family protein [Deltaproteobacteria bacterium]
MATVVFSSGLQRYTGGVERVNVDATDVRGLIAALDTRFPGIGQVIGSGMAVAIDGEIIPDAMLEAVPPDGEVHFLPPIGGGAGGDRGRTAQRT